MSDCMRPTKLKMFITCSFQNNCQPLISIKDFSFVNEEARAQQAAA